MSQEKPKKDLFHVALSKQIAEQIKRGTASFLNAQENEHIDMPYNPVTGKNYTAANNMVLSAKGYTDSRWLTYDQAAEQGYQVKKGEKATEIAYYHYIDYNTKEKLDKPKIQIVKLFNAQQLTGIEKMPSRTSSKEEALAKVQSIFENSQVKIVNNQKDKVFYRSKDDTIYMPPKESYKDELAYSSAALHELCRWSGNGEDRLNYETVPFGTEAFARQKLRTEIATYMLCKEIGIPFEPQGQQFADQWAKTIEEHPFEILNAAKDAEKMKGFVMEFDKTLEKAQELEQGQEVQKEKKYFEPSEHTDYYKVYEHGHTRTTSFNLYDISQLYAMCEEKHRELIEIDLFRSQIEDTIASNEGEDWIDKEKERLEQVEKAQKEGYTYAIYNPEFTENGITFITGHTLEELIKEISFYSDALDLHSIEFEPMSDHSVDITVPEKDRERVAEFGAEFDEEENRWYIPEGTNLTPFENWMYKEVEIQPIQQAEQAPQAEQTQQEAPKKEPIEIIKLSVLYEDKEEAKKLGAKWSAKLGTWYVLEGTDLQPFQSWLPKEVKKDLIIASRDYLDVPKEEKDEAKALGAKWDKYQKAWYVEKGTDLEPFAKWGKLDFEKREKAQEEWKNLPKEERKNIILSGRDYLDVPKEEKDEAKALGAKWDKYQKAWYVEKGTDLEPFAKWGKLDLNERATQAEQVKEQSIAQTPPAEQEQKAEQHPAEDKTFIAVPFDERNDAKKLGAKWDKDNKSWYIEKGTDLNQFKEWLVDENTVVPAKQETVSPEIEFAQHCRANGLDVDNPIMDGQIHRVALIDRPQGKDGAYCAFLDGVPAGWSQNYVTGEKSKFICSGIQLTEEEKTKQRAEHAQKLQERETKRQIGYDNAAKRAEKIYLEAKEVTAQNIHGEDSYLGKKGVLPHIAKQNDYGQLIIPLHNIEGEIRGVQFINQDGSKHFLSGIEKKGNFTLLSDDAKDATKLLVCEGFATGASLHEATKLPVAVAFDAGNIESVSKALSEKYKGVEITICADNDQYRDNNVGLEKAKKAALAVGAKLAVPQFSKEEQAQKLTDFNDLHKAEGLEAVSKQVSQAKKLTQNLAQNKSQSKNKTAQLAR